MRACHVCVRACVSGEAKTPSHLWHLLLNLAQLPQQLLGAQRILRAAATLATAAAPQYCLARPEVHR
jgi:hypothetical protein